MKKIIVTILLCLSFNLSYADTTFYTFVMHKPTGTDDWQHFYHNEKIVPGLYRFQIIMLSESSQNTLTSWWNAVWGEFQFVDDPAGGVKIYARNILNERNSFSSWANISKTWSDVRKKRLQPIIVRMKKEEPLGYPDPNLMRFLVLKRNTSESWQWKNNNYHVYRLHYFDSELMEKDEYKQALSYFIKPNEAPTNDIEQLKTWLNVEKELTPLAQHATTPEDKYGELHEYFRTWFNKLLTTEVIGQEPTEDGFFGKYWWVFILLIVAIFIYRNKKISRKIRLLWNQKFKPMLGKKHFFEQPMTTTSYMNKEEVEMLKVELKQLRVRINKLEGQLKEAKLNPASTELIENEVKIFLNGQFNNEVNKTLELYANQFWQEFINKNTTSSSQEEVQPNKEAE
ncbi:hypothetical protein QUF74_09795 [Candidatus Halobeggiatoa sp. HSG11]|nr:hypothetical protein [Candidatus Halobeggiatoa sp. HSG11]